MPETTTALDSKGNVIASLNALPAGLADFLEVGIPEVPTVDLPGDVEAAIIANGVAAKFILDLFKAFEGMYLAALPLHVGQDNSWIKAGVLAGLQALSSGTAAEAEAAPAGSLRIISPADGQSYLPGDLRVHVQAKTGTLQSASVTIAGEVTLLSAEQGSFWGYVTLPDEGDYTAEVIGSFGDDDTVSASAAFTIAADATAAAEGDDLKALDVAKSTFDDAVQQAISAVAGSASEAGPLQMVKAAAVKCWNVAQGLGSASESLWQAVSDKIAALEAYIEGSRAMPGRGLDSPAVNLVSDLQVAVNTAVAAVVQAWEQAHPHPPSGYAYGPKTLKGAAQAMNAKYGAGTVN